MVVDWIANDVEFERMVRRLAGPRGVLSVSGLWGSSAPLVAAEVFRRVERPVLFVTAHLEEADDARDDVEFFLGRDCELLGAWETLPGEGPGSGEIHAERLRVCAGLAAGAGMGFMVAPVQALMQPVPTAKSLEANTLRLAAGRAGDPDRLTRWLVDHGFERLDMVETPGDFARRGGILDIFAPGELHPCRIEFFDDHIESIRSFDISTQRSIARVDALAIPAAPQVKDVAGEELTSFLDYVPEETLVVLDGPAEIQEMGTIFRNRLDDPESLYDVRAVFRRMGPFGQVHLSRFGGAGTGGEDSFRLDVSSLSRFDGKASNAIGELIDLAADRRVVVACENAGQETRLKELLKETAGDVPGSIETVIGHLHQGFEWVSSRTVVVGHHEVFRRERQRRRIRRTEAVRPLETWLDLSPGDIVVHARHGLAKFRTMEPMKKAGSEKKEEFLTLEFADKAMLHVPVSQIDLVQKYVGAAGMRPKLSKLGGTRWSKTKERVQEAVVELAGALLRVQAAREANPGVAYPADTTWQREFEEAFEYEETDDQTIVAGEVKGDLCRSRPMDRLLCGDVGYGKTELAMRAAFKVAEYGKQVAVLVPTTVLAEQHYETFRSRMADYPFMIGCLSRFRSGSEQKRLIEEIKKGRIDVVVGTHRLLSKDVAFADLGLVVIDEEQRFGVEHKEKLKHLRETVEVLTMTATPIPRTLHMSMLGIRDISSLATPPVDRRSIATQVRHFDEGLIRTAINRELNRDGQVFFVHNIVKSIYATADIIRRIVPEARVVVGHGQMKEGELEEVMNQFVHRKADVLVCTTIIESGIDITAANTIFIDRADRFGLADLHQLRGRVGRSKHRAYCYLLISPSRSVTPKAARRLKSVEEFSELGAGFRIAMRDLEIRGAGNILGPEQSGHIAAVGYDMYCRLLSKAVHNLRDEPEPDLAPVHLELGVGAFIPRTYIASERARIEIYRRTVGCCTAEDLRQLEEDVVDAYGQFPPSVATLLELAEIRVSARRWKINSIISQQPDIVFAITDLALVQALFDGAPGSVRMPDPKTIHLRLRDAYFETPTLIGFLRRFLSKGLKAQEQKK